MLLTVTVFELAINPTHRSLLLSAATNSTYPSPLVIVSCETAVDWQYPQFMTFFSTVPITDKFLTFVHLTAAPEDDSPVINVKLPETARLPAASRDLTR